MVGLAVTAYVTGERLATGNGILAKRCWKTSLPFPLPGPDLGLGELAEGELCPKIKGVCAVRSKSLWVAYVLAKRLLAQPHMRPGATRFDFSGVRFPK